MTRLRRFDAWVGLRVFQPPLVRFCQATGMTQHQLARDMWFAVGLWLAWEANANGTGFLGMSLLLLVAGMLGVRAALTPPAVPSLTLFGFRVMWWLLVLWGLPLLWVDPLGGINELAQNLFILGAEYAATITTIPPRKRLNRAKGWVRSA